MLERRKNLPLIVAWLLWFVTAVLITACGAGSNSVPSPGAQRATPAGKPTSSPGATKQPGDPISNSSASPCSSDCVTPLAASAFTNSIGVGTHLTYPGVYESGYATYEPMLANSGIKHIRDGLCSYGAHSTYCTGTWVAELNQLAAAGIRFDMVWDPRICWSSAATPGCQNVTTPANVYASTLGIAADIEAYEGPNECDISSLCPGIKGQAASNPPAWSYSCSSFDTCMTIFIEDLGTLRSPGVSVYGPPMAFASSSPGYACCGNMAAYMTASSMHDYPGNNYPESGYDPNSWIPAAQQLNGGGPVVSTETGYYTNPPTYANQGVDLLTQERLTPRILFTHLYYGVMRTYLYELVDEGSTLNVGYGLLNYDSTPKPAWTRLKQLISYFSDSGTSPRTPIAYTLSGDTTGELFKVLFQKSNGTYILVPWLGTRQWSSTNADIAPTTETLMLMLPPAVTSVTVTQFGDNGVTTVTTLSRKSNDCFSLPVSSLIEAVSFNV
jgi:hypothetical protein